MSKKMGKILSIVLVFAMSIQLFSVAAFATDTSAFALTAKAGYTTVSLNWEEVTGAADYTVTRNGVQIATSAGTSYNDTTVSANVEYTYSITASTGAASNAAVVTPGIKSVMDNAALNYDFDETEGNFDGTKVLDKSADLSKIINLNQGSLIIKSRFAKKLSDAGNFNYAMFGISTDGRNASTAIAIGAQNSYGSMKVRTEFYGGMKTWASDDNYFDNDWHVMVITMRSGLIEMTVDGKTGWTTTSTTGLDGFFSRYQKSANDKFYIGGIYGVATNGTGAKYTPWAGDIDYFTVTATPIETAEAISLTSAEKARSVVISATAKASYSTVKLNWATIDGAESYTVMRDGTPLTTVSDTSYTDTTTVTGTEYTYKVVASTGAESKEMKAIPSLQSLMDNAAVSYDLDKAEGNFDGTKVLDKTEDLSKFIGLKDGSVIIKSRFGGTGNVDKKDYVMFGVGADGKDYNSIIDLGVQYDTGKMKARPEFVGGMRVWGSADNYLDNDWHVMVITMRSGLLETTVDGQTGWSSTTLPTLEGFFSRYVKTANDKFYIGGVYCTGNNVTGAAYTNWVGDIDYLTITGTPIDTEEAMALTASEKAKSLTVNATATATYNTVNLSWTAISGATSYTISRNGTEIKNTTELSYCDTDVTTGTEYTYVVTASTGSQSDEIKATPSLKAIKDKAAVNYDFDETTGSFDGTRVIDKTEDLSKFVGLKQGSVIIKSRFGGNAQMAGNKNFAMFGVSADGKDFKGAITLGTQQSGGPMRARPEFIDGMRTWAGDNNYFDNAWHVMVITMRNGLIEMTIDGQTGWTTNATTGLDGFFSRYIKTTDDKFYIGGVYGVTANNLGAYTNWVGDIGYLTITGTPIETAAAKALTLDEKNLTRAKRTVTFSDKKGKNLAQYTVYEGDAIDANTQTVALSLVPQVYGYDFLNWDKDISAAVYDDTVFTPVYVKRDNKFQLTVVDGTTEISEASFDTKVYVTAKGTNFVCWKNENGTVIGTDKTIGFFMPGNTTVTAYYEGDVGATTEMANVFAAANPIVEDYSNDSTKYNIVLLGQIRLPEDAEFVKAGAIFANGTKSDYSDEGFVLDTAQFKIAETSITLYNKAFMCVLRKVNNTSSRKARLFIVYKLDGQTHIEYSQIFTVSK